jgi:RHS repeat-associated protein
MIGAAAVRQYTPHPLWPVPLAIHVAGSTWVPLFDGHLDCVAVCDPAGAVLERYRYEPFGAPTVLTPAGAPIAASAIGFEPRFGAMRFLATAGRYLAGRRLLDPRHGLFLSPDPMGHADSPNLYAFAGQDPIDAVDPDGDLFWFVVAVIAVGVVVGGGMNAARQGIQIAEGSRQEFSWGEFGGSAALGGVLAPVVVFAPEVAIPLAGLGLASSANEFSQGHYATGTFDLVTSIAPFGFSKVRTSTFGQGSAFSWAAGRGPITGATQRWGNVVSSGESIVNTARNLGSSRFYRGTTYYEALQAEQDNAIDLAAVLNRQQTAAAPPRLGPGLYVTNEPGNSGIPGSAQYWADLHGLHGRAGGPAVLEATVSWWNMRGLRNAPGVQLDLPQPNFPPNRANVESFFPFDPQSPTPAGPAARFNELATWRLWDPNAPQPSLVVPWTGYTVLPWWTTPEGGGKK